MNAPPSLTNLPIIPNNERKNENGEKSHGKQGGEKHAFFGVQTIASSKMVKWVPLIVGHAIYLVHLRYKRLLSHRRLRRPISSHSRRPIDRQRFCCPIYLTTAGNENYRNCCHFEWSKDIRFFLMLTVANTHGMHCPPGSHVGHCYMSDHSHRLCRHGAASTGIRPAIKRIR